MNYIIIILYVVVGLLGLLPSRGQAQRPESGPEQASMPVVMPIVQWSHPLLREMRGWWKALPGLAPGNVWIDLIQRNDAIFSGAYYTPTLGWVPLARQGGYMGLQFDGTGAFYVRVPHTAAHSFEKTDPFTMALWWKEKTGSGTTDLVTKQVAAGNYPGWGLRVSGNAPLLQLNDDGTGVLQCYAPATAVIDDATWHHVTYRYDGSNSVGGMTVGVDGQMMACGGTSGTSLAGSMASTGFMAFAASGWDGPGTMMNDFRMWGRALSDQEVALVYQQSLLGDPALLSPPQGQVVLAPVAGHPGAFFPWFR